MNPVISTEYIYFSKTVVPQTIYKQTGPGNNRPCSTVDASEGGHKQGLCMNSTFVQSGRCHTCVTVTDSPNTHNNYGGVL